MLVLNISMPVMTPSARFIPGIVTLLLGVIYRLSSESGRYRAMGIPCRADLIDEDVPAVSCKNKVVSIERDVGFAHALMAEYAPNVCTIFMAPVETS